MSDKYIYELPKLRLSIFNLISKDAVKMFHPKFKDQLPDTVLAIPISNKRLSFRQEMIARAKP